MSKVEMGGNLQQDISGSEQEKQKPGLELVHGKELNTVVDVSNDLAGKMERDEKVTGEDVLKLDEALGKMKIDFFGDQMTVDEIKKIPDLERNIEIWKKIIQGETHGATDFSFIILKIAEKLMENTNRKGDSFLVFNKLKILSDDVAEMFARRSSGMELLFNNLESLSDKAVDSFCRSSIHVLSIRKVVSLSDKAIEMMVKSKKNFNFSESVQKRVDEYLAKNKK